MPEKPPLAAIFGCAGTKLKPGEIDLFRQNNPLGLILFERNFWPDWGRIYFKYIKIYFFWFFF